MTRNRTTGRCGRRLSLMLGTLLAATLAAPTFAQLSVPGTSNPYLAGMPNGSTCCSGDTAPAQSPVQVTSIAVTPGTRLAFSATGSVTFDSSMPPSQPPDGGTIFTTASSNGIAGGTWPENTLLGVFLDASAPNTTAAPGALDFSPSGLGTGFATLAPALKQPFFIGDGLTGNGTGAVQTFVVPVGATRLYLGTSDGFGWFNNAGAFSATVSIVQAGPPAAPAQIPTLALPMLVLLSLGIVGLRYRLQRRS